MSNNKTTTKNKSKKTPAIKAAGLTAQLPGVRKIVATPVIKLLFGLTPNDDVLVPSRVEDSSGATAKLEIVKKYLKKNPALEEAVTKEATAAWGKAKGDRSAYLTALRSRRMEILSRAELAFAAEQAPAIIANVRDGLSRYLTEIEKATDARIKV